MWQVFKQFLPQDSPAHHDDSLLELAVAALLVRASVIDGDISPSETARISALLNERFGLSQEAVAKLTAEAREAEAEAVDLYRFTRVITEKLDQDGRLGLIEMLWEIVLADGPVDPFEGNLVWRVAELIGVSTRDRVTLRKKVERRLAEAKPSGPWG